MRDGVQEGAPGAMEQGGAVVFQGNMQCTLKEKKCYSHVHTQESFVLSWHSCSETGNVNFDQCLPAWRAAGPMARSTLAEVRRLFTFPEAKAVVDPKNTKISYAAVLIRKRLKKAAAASYNLTKT